MFERCRLWACANAQTRQSLSYSRTQGMSVDKDADQNLDLHFYWIRRHGVFWNQNVMSHVRIQRLGDRGSDPHLENYKAIGFLSSTGPGPDSLENYKDSMFGYYRHASATPFKCRCAGGPMMALYQWYCDPPPLKTKNNNKKKKTFSKLNWTPSDKTSWICACVLAQIH